VFAGSLFSGSLLNPEPVGPGASALALVQV
jgi:hypothetical protein